MKVKSLYNTSSVQRAQAPAGTDSFGQYGITITTKMIGVDGNPIVIPGVLKEALGYSVDANWSTLNLGGIIDSIAASNSILEAIDTIYEASNQVTGKSFVNSGLFTRLFYKNSGRLGINPIFRIIDYQGRGICAQQANILSALCIPTVRKGKQISMAGIANNATTLVNKIPETGWSVIDAGIGNTKEAINALKDETLNWSDAPLPVTLKIGTWLTIYKAVVESVTFNFSYECTDAGPIWVDVNMKLSTLENLVIGTDGSLEQVEIGKGENGGRVQIIKPLPEVLEQQPSTPYKNTNWTVYRNAQGVPVDCQLF